MFPAQENEKPVIPVVSPSGESAPVQNPIPVSNSGVTPPVLSQAPMATTTPGISVAGKKGWAQKLLFLIPIALLLGTMIVVAALLPSFRKPAVVVPTPTIEPTLIPATPIPTVKPDPRQGWKEYLNRDAQLSFRYPPNLSLREQKTGLNLYTITLTDEASASATVLKILSGKNTTSTELLNANGEADLAIKSAESEVEVSGIVSKKITSSLVSDPAKSIVYTATDQSPSAYVFFLYDPSLTEMYDLLLARVRFVTPGITADWQTYTNTFGGYTLRFPPGWILNSSNTNTKLSAADATASAQVVSIRKNQTEAQFQNLVIQTSVITGKTRVDLNASEAVTSIQNLSGWRVTPNTDFRTIGGAQAQIISGEKDGAWHSYAVLWFRSTLVEVSWRDTLLRKEQETFDDMLGSFQFR